VFTQKKIYCDRTLLRENVVSISNDLGSTTKLRRQVGRK